MDELSGESPRQFHKYKTPLVGVVLAISVILIIGKLFVAKNQDSAMQFIEESTASATKTENITAEIAGAVDRPGVYSLSADSRVQDLLVSAGGLNVQADRDWVAKHVNLAAKLVDGGKIYVPTEVEMANAQDIHAAAPILGVTETSASNSIININTASEGDLDTLPGIGPITAKKIIAGRPYRSVDELLQKKVVNKSVFEKIKTKVTVY